MTRAAQAGTQAETITALVDAGAAALHRVTSVLAHQRVDIRSLALEPSADGSGLARLRIEVEAAPGSAERLVGRLRRTVPVHEAHVVTGRRT